MSLLNCVIGTAGHIDHGKTSLVEALTGINCDRFEEEKRRGITIDIGFASLTLKDGRKVGVVDVPGHQRFIHNMLAGAAGIDIALLVVAADDGVMPQTVEHLAILEILNARRGVVALTKIDMVDRETAELARLDVEELLEGSPLKGAKIIPCSAMTGEGIEDIRAELERLALMTPPKSGDGFFRMPIDRVFTIKGHGVVITGTVTSGEAKIDDRIILTPGGGEGRVRRIQNHGVPAETSKAGSRTALNLVGVEKSAIRRGMVACHPAIARPCDMFTADIFCHRSSPHVIAHGRSYLLHAHTAETLCRVYLSSSKSLQPGEGCVAQIRFDEPIQMLHGDRFALRSSSARHTVGGGAVLEPGGHPMGRRALLKNSKKWKALKDRSTGVKAFIGQCPWGRPVEEIMSVFNLPEKQLKPLFEKLDGVSVFEWKGVRHAFTKSEADRIIEQVAGAISGWHEKHPASDGIEESLVLKTALREIGERLGAYWIRRAVAEGKVEQKGSTLRLPGYTAEFTGEDEGLRSRILGLFQEGGFNPAKTDKAHVTLGLKREPVMKMIGNLIRSGDLITLAPDYTLGRDVLEKAKQILLDEIAIEGHIETGRYRDLLGVGRKAAIDILEYFDNNGLTRRTDNRGRRILAASPPEG